MEKPTTVRMSAEDRYRLQRLALLFKTQTNVIHRAIGLMWAGYAGKAEEVARIVRQERNPTGTGITQETTRDEQELLFEMFVSPETTREEVAGMDLWILTKHIREQRKAQPDDVSMIHGGIASAILAFARGGPMRTTTDRAQQASWLRELAGNIAANLGEGTAEELVAYALTEEGREDWAIEIPEWFDDHDRGLLVQFVGENLD